MIEFLLASALFITPSAVGKIEAFAGKITTPSISGKQFSCMANAVFHEAGNQSLEGKLAVASVILNRAKSSRFPDSPCDVVHQRNQFSFVDKIKAERDKLKRKAHWEAVYLIRKEHKKVSAKLFKQQVARKELFLLKEKEAKASKKNYLDQIAFEQSKTAVWMASKLSQYIDPTHGALFYYAPKAVKSVPKWASMASSSIAIGDHVFLYGVR